MKFSLCIVTVCIAKAVHGQVRGGAYDGHKKARRLGGTRCREFLGISTLMDTDCDETTTAPSAEILPAETVPTLAPSASPGPSGALSDVPSLVPSAVDDGRIDAVPTLPPSALPAPSDSKCLAYPACSGLSGDCCPTMDNIFLDCCYGITGIPASSPTASPTYGNRPDGFPTSAPSASPGPSGAPSDVLSPAPSAVDDGHIDGAPTLAPSVSPGPSGSPSDVPSFVPSDGDDNRAEGIPTLAPSASPGPSGAPSDVPSLVSSAVNDGRIDAVPTLPPSALPAPSDSKCLAYPACSGLSGDCCPTMDNIFLDCCYGITGIPASSPTTSPTYGNRADGFPT